MLQDSSAADLLGRAVRDVSGTGPDNCPANCSELPEICAFFTNAIQLWMPRAVPAWLESCVEPMQQDLKHFTSAKKVYEVERMSAIIRLVLGTTAKTELAHVLHDAFGVAAYSARR
jgi:hypothetical protein